jgi:putative methyltransferase (TIGR04325 family)
MKLSNYKNILKDWIPPVITKSVVKILALDPSERKTYGSYQEAMQDTENPDGYELDNIVKLEFLRTKKIKEELEQPEHIQISDVDLKGLVSLSAFISKKKITVIDLGGGCGRHYFFKRKLLAPDIELNWYVVETPAMCNYGKALENGELRFRDNLADTIKEAGHIDMVYASGVLQCVDKPWEFLDLITSCKADFIFFHRLALSNKKDVTVIHKYSLSWNGTYQLPEGVEDRIVAYPFSFIEKKRFFETLQKTYSILMEFNEQSGVFPVKGEELTGLGLLCKLKN